MSAGDVHAALMSVPTIRAALEGALDALSLIEQALGSALDETASAGTAAADLGKLVAAATGQRSGPTEPEPEPDPELWPDTATWDEKIDWIIGQAGVKAVELRTVGPSFVPDGCRLQSGILYIDAATLVENIVYDGQIRPSNQSTEPVTLRNVAARDVFAGSTETLARIAVVEDCEFTVPVAQAIGTGALNAMRAGFVIRRSIMQGSVDGMQCSGGGTVEDSVIRALTITGSSHNDFIQNYGGHIEMRRTYMEQLNVPANHLNGLFADGGTYDLEDCAVVVTAAPGTNAWALHAGKYSTPNQIVARRCYVRGRKVGQVVFEADVDYDAGY